LGCNGEGVTKECVQTVMKCQHDNIDRRFVNVQLIAGARDGEVSVVSEALRAGACTETRSPMKIFAGTSSSEVPELQVQVFKKRCGPTPLMLAAKSGSVPCIKVLLAHRAHLGARDEDGMRAVHFAALSGEFAALKALLEARANPCAMDAERRAPLDHLPSEARSDPGELRRWRELLERAAFERRGRKLTEAAAGEGFDEDGSLAAASEAAEEEEGRLSAGLPEGSFGAAPPNRCSAEDPEVTIERLIGHVTPTVPVVGDTGRMV